MNLSNRSNAKSESNNGSLLSEDEQKILLETLEGVRIKIKAA
jgi:hypothetical protein